jgi:O-antigen/teichoic acid export membrane protein
MAELRFRDALWGDAISYLGQVLALIIVAREGALGISAAFAVMAATSLISAVLQVVQAGVLAPAWHDILPVAKRFCSLGIWPMLGSLASALTVQVFPWTLAVARGPAQTAMYQAVVNLVSVSHPLLFSVGSLIVPASARAMAKNGIHAAKRIALRYGAQGALLAVPYYLVLFLFPKPALRLVYGASSPYVKLGQGVRMFVTAYAFVYLSQVLASLFNGIARGKLVFMASLAGGRDCAVRSDSVDRTAGDDRCDHCFLFRLRRSFAALCLLLSKCGIKVSRLGPCYSPLVGNMFGSLGKMYRSAVLTRRKVCGLGPGNSGCL